MRKLKLQIQISIDGFIAGPKGEMDWMEWNWDDGLKKYVAEITEQVDCILLGRKLAQGFIPHWANNPNEEGADIFNNTKKIVFTKTLNETDAIVKEWNNTVLAKGDLVDEITQLKKQSGKDMIVYGGATFVSTLIKHQLIDEFHLFINPTAIGKGMAIFQNLDTDLNLKLVQSKQFSCGMALLHYNLIKSHS